VRLKIHRIKAGQVLEPEKKVRYKKKGKKHPVIRGIVVLILLIVTIVLIGRSSLFNIAGIEIKGSMHYSNENIIGATDIVVGKNGFETIGKSLKNIFTFRYFEAEKGILENHPYIKDAFVKYAIPGKIKITILERYPYILIPYMGTNLLMDREGYILDNAIDSSENNLPIVKGLSFLPYKVGQALIVKRKGDIETINEIVDKINNDDKNSEFKVNSILDYIDISDSSNIRLFIDSRITVNLGDLQNLDYRIKFLREVLLNHTKKDDKGTLDFTTGENPNFITI
jgi:cell division protein FtsQ